MGNWKEIKIKMSTRYSQEVIGLLHVGLTHVFFLPKNVTEGVVGKSSPTASYVMVNQSISTEPCTVTCRENYFCCLWTTFKLIYFRLCMLVVHLSSGKCV